MHPAMSRKVLLIGWDAADWKVITPLLDAGRMPHLERLVTGGVMGNLATLQPALSPMLWTSIATGKRAYKHGIHGFAEPDPRTGGVRPITNLGRKVKAVWNILQQNGLQSNVVGWWPSFPAEPISGVMVSNHFQQAPKADPTAPWPLKPGVLHPPRLAEALAEFRIRPSEFEGDMLLPFVPRAESIDQQKDPRLFSLAKILAENAGVHAAATALIQHEPWDFMAVYFDGIDHLCHAFMKYHPPRLEWVSEADFDLYQGVINGGYEFFDLMLGAYLQLAGEETTVIVMSDHGFHPDHLRPREIPNEPAGPADEHREFGILAMRGPGLKRDELIHGAGLLDITPTILTLFGLPLGRDMDGRPLVNAFIEPPPITTIDSWEDVSGDTGQHPPNLQADPVDQAEALRQLVDLGYIEKPDEDLQKATADCIRELRYNLARDCFDARRIPEAAAIFGELWEGSPDQGRFGVHLINCHLMLNQPEQAGEVLQRLIQEKQRYSREAAETLQSRRAAWEKEGRKVEDLNEQEVREVRQLKKRAGVNLQTLSFLRARVLEASGKYREALELFAKCREVQVHNQPSVLLHMANCQFALRQLDEAGNLYREILEIDPVNSGARLGLARVHRHRRDPQATLAEALASVGLTFQNAQAHYLCGWALARLGREEEAGAALQTALSQNPVYPSAQRLMAILHQRAGRHDQAATHRALARVATDRIRAFRAGASPPEDVDLALDLELQQPATVASLSVTQPLPPPDAQTIVVVSGLPRSGTSMMMQMLAAGGLPVLSDGERAADENNPRGYLELEAVKRLGRDSDVSWLEQAGGRAVKIVAPLLPHLPSNHRYRIVFMERPLREVLASQKAMLQNLGKPGGQSSERQLGMSYLRQVEQLRTIIAANAEQIQVLAVDYHGALSDPAGTAQRVNAFLGGTFDEIAMQRAIDPNLRRQKS
jgi:tetratricopeptide (TPR) repeat protein